MWKIDACLDTLNSWQYFNSCDLRWGYWQMGINERDHDKTVFVMRKGQWHFKVLSFGLCSSPSQFAHIMELVLSGLTYDLCLVYLDDVLVFSKTLDEHYDRLTAIFDQLSAICFSVRLPFLAMLQRPGIECNPSKVAAIAGRPWPMNISEVRTFCGLVFHAGLCAYGPATAQPLQKECALQPG